MAVTSDIIQKLEQLLQANSKSFDNQRNCNTTQRLEEIASSFSFDAPFSKTLDFYCQKFEKSGKICSSYTKDGKVEDPNPITAYGMQIFALLVYLKTLTIFEREGSLIERSKSLNLCLKVSDTPSIYALFKSKQINLEELQWQILDRSQKSHVKSKFDSTTKINSKAKDTEFKKLPIDILFYEGPIARAYLETLYLLGLKPRRIVRLVLDRDTYTGKKHLKYFPRSVQIRYSKLSHFQRMTHWKRVLARKYPTVIRDVHASISEFFNIPLNSIENAQKFIHLDKYCDDVDDLVIANVKDVRLQEYLESATSQNYIFTGGGILPKEIFNLPHLNLLHIHPGYLPDIRGADGLLWSSIILGAPSVSSFVMDAGLDTGRLLHTEILPTLPLQVSTKHMTAKMKYRLIYSSVDPWIRAHGLIQTLEKTHSFRNIQGVNQNITHGTEFHFMHPSLYDKVISSF